MNLTPPSPFEYNDSNRATASARWRVWKREVDLLLANDISDKGKKLWVALNQAGPEIREIFYANMGEVKEYDAAMQKLGEYFEPMKCTNWAIYQFSQLTQGERGHEGENIDDYVVRLRTAGRRVSLGTRSTRSSGGSFYAVRHTRRCVESF